HVYIAYEFVPGRTFREAMRAGELNDAAAIEACAQICDGLAHAHAAGILHRDVKPSNVLLAAGDQVSVRLLDFGLAQFAEAETLTAQGDVPGTLAYIAPERLAGEDAEEASDVWAVGVMLWEALSGRHPFWQTSMLDTARAIESGAPSLAVLRPDLPKGLVQLVDRSLSLDPARRPSAADLSRWLRGAVPLRRQRKAKGRDLVALQPGWVGRAGAALLAGAFAGWTAQALPFYPHGWAAGLAVAATAVTSLRERVGLALALAVPVLPLGNVSFGLALLYAALAAAWLALSWREPRGGLLFALGPVLAPLAALGLVPLAASLLRAGPRRAAQAALAVLVAGVVAGLRHASLPFTGARPPLGVGVAGAASPLAVAGSLARAATAHPALLVEAAAFAAIALAVPYAQARGRWGAAGLGAAMLVLTVLAVPSAAAAPLVAAAWLTATVVAVRAARA
ncbi:MAG TPA: serine/threonine-protein kinase, partial [Gaiellaceae bacterium]|nr:serine/threonine-protein kinase [Gaiellaceae bacterium]